jgi:hypothetical protein
MVKKDKVPQIDLNLHVKKKNPDSQTTRLNHNSYNVFMLIKDKEKLLHLYRRSNLDKKSFYRAIERLLREGLIYQIFEQKDSKAKIDIIKSSLTTYIGPIAPMIVDEILMDLGYSDVNFPESKVDYLIEIITQQMPDIQAIEFKKNIVKLIDQ